MDTTHDDMKDGSGKAMPKGGTGVHGTTGREGMTLIGALLLLLVIVTGALGYYWNVKAKEVAEQEESLRALTDRRDELEQAVAEHRAKSEAVGEEETETASVESLEALTLELEELKKERDSLAEECQKWKDRVAGIQKQQEQVRAREENHLKTIMNQAAKTQSEVASKDKARQDIREAQIFYGKYCDVYFFVPDYGRWYARRSLRHMSKAGIDALTSKDTSYCVSTPPKWMRSSLDLSEQKAYARQMTQYRRYLKLKAMFEELAKHPEHYRD